MLAATSFDAFGFKIASADAGRARVLVPALGSNLRPGGIIAGYIYTAAADVAVWLALKTILGIEDDSVMVDLHTAFVAATSSDFVCDARIVRCGRRIVCAVATCCDDANVLTEHIITYARRFRAPAGYTNATVS